MTLNIEREYDLELGIDCEKTAKQVAAQVLKEEGCPFETEISLLLTSNGQSHGRAVLSAGRIPGAF